MEQLRTEDQKAPKRENDRGTESSHHRLAKGAERQPRGGSVASMAFKTTGAEASSPAPV